MKITAHDEYGLRILLRIARDDNGTGLSIPAISQMEGMSFHNTAKFCGILRKAGFIVSTQGHAGGYKLARPANEMNLRVLFTSLGGLLFDESHCDDKKGTTASCNNSVNCSIRSFWKILQYSMDSILDNLSLEDLIEDEKNLDKMLMRQFNDQNT